MLTSMSIFDKLTDPAKCTPCHPVNLKAQSRANPLLRSASCRPATRAAGAGAGAAGALVPLLRVLLLSLYLSHSFAFDCPDTGSHRQRFDADGRGRGKAGTTTDYELTNDPEIFFHRSTPQPSTRETPRSPARAKGGGSTPASPSWRQWKREMHNAPGATPPILSRKIVFQDEGEVERSREILTFFYAEVDPPGAAPERSENTPTNACRRQRLSISVRAGTH